MDMINFAKNVFDIEIEELTKVRDRIDNRFVEVVNAILDCKGKVVVTGVGKSGIIGKKLAATMASTGTTTVFMHSAEGLHGDLGIIAKGDLVIAISNGGNSDEVLSLIPTIKTLGVPLVAMTGNLKSSLAKESDYILDIHVEKEACPINLAPTSSTTATLVMGDALATILIKLKSFEPENFALYHPGGSLGRRLLLKVKDVMNNLHKLAIVNEDTDISEIIIEMTNKNLGAVCVNKGEELIGLITEGDVRRALMDKERFFSYKAKDIMTRNCISISSDKMAIEALQIMEERESKISVLPVVDDNVLKGLVRIHDLLSIAK